METNKFVVIKNRVQEIIDLVALKNKNESRLKLIEVNELLDEVIDFSDSDEDIIEISRYQVLLNHLHQKINNSTDENELF